MKKTKFPDPSGKKLPLVITPDLRRLMDKPAGMGVAVIKNILNRLVDKFDFWKQTNSDIFQRFLSSGNFHYF